MTRRAASGTTRRRKRIKTPKLTKAALFESLKPIADCIQRTFGEKCEVVLHDFKDPAHSIVWIQGNVTGRKVGGGVSEIGLQMIRGGAGEPDRIAYVRNTRNGKIIKATTILLRSPTGKVHGCLCINLDVTDLVAGRNSLDAFVGQVQPREMPFTDQMAETLTGLIRGAESEIGRSAEAMGRDELPQLIQILEARGAFTIRKSVPEIARYLGLSRATVYKYLNTTRNGAARKRHRETSGGSVPTPPGTL